MGRANIFKLERNMGRANTFVQKIILLTFVAMFVIATKSFAGVFFADGFEPGGATSISTNGASWGDKAYVSLSNSRAKSGTTSLEFRYLATDSGDAWAEQKFSLGEKFKEIWIKYDLYVPDNYYHRNQVGSSNNKGNFMLWSGSYSSSPQILAIEWWPNNGASEISNEWRTGTNTSYHYKNPNDVRPDFLGSGNAHIKAIDPAKDNGRWVEFIIHVKVSDIDSNTGITDMWKDGELIWSIRSATNYASTEEMNHFEFGYLLGYSNSGFTEETRFYIDDVVFSTDSIASALGTSTAIKNIPFNFTRPLFKNADAATFYSLDGRAVLKPLVNAIYLKRIKKRKK